jgi:transcriptional regulator with XRE-family HTH domain
MPYSLSENGLKSMGEVRHLDGVHRMLELARGLDLTQAELAKRIGESQQVVNNWKRRGAIPGGKLAKVARGLGVTVEEILTGQRPGADEPADFDPDTLRLARAFQLLSVRDRAHVQAVADAFGKSVSGEVEWSTAGEAERRRAGERKRARDRRKMAGEGHTPKPGASDLPSFRGISDQKRSSTSKTGLKPPPDPIHSQAEVLLERPDAPLQGLGIG